MAVFTSIAASIFGAGTFMAAVTAGALQVAAGIALSYIGKAIAGEPEGSKFGVQGNMQGGDDVPRSILFGWAATSGSLAYFNTWGTASGVKNAYHTQVIALADFPISGLTKVFANNLAVTLLTGSPHAQRGWPVSEYRKNGVDHLWVKFYDGTQTAADTFLTGTVSSTDRPYAATRVGVGIPYVIVTCMAPERKDGEEKPLFSGGVPKFMFEVQGSKLYDMSKDSTNGGSGTHRWNNPATWGGDGDFMPVVQAYSLLRGLSYSGQWLYGLQSLSSTRLPSAEWIAAIAKCRATTSAGVTKYRSGGEIQVGAQIRYALEAMLTTCNGRLTEVGGTYKPFVGEPGSAVYAFTDADIISTEGQTFTPFFGLEDTINGMSAKWPNPAEGWVIKKAKVLLRPDLEARDGNRRLMADAVLDMVPYAEQVQRVMKSGLAEAQRARRHTFTMGPEFWVLEPGDVVSWTSARNGYETKLFRVDGIGDLANLDVLLDLTEVDPSDYNWNPETDYTPVIDGPIQIVDTPPMPMIGWQVYGVIVNDNSGNPRRPGIEVWYQPGLQNVESVRVQVRMPGEDDPFIDVPVAYGSPWRTQIVGNLINNVEYEVRGIYVMADRARAEWSDWLSVTTPDVKLGGLDVYLDSDMPGLSDAINELTEWATGGVRDLINDAREMQRLALIGMLEGYDNVETAQRRVTASSDAMRASYTETIVAAIGPNGAITSRLEELESSVNGSIATAVNLLRTEVFGEGGEGGLAGDVQSLAEAVTSLSAANTAGDVNTANLRMGVKTGPTGYSRISFNVRQSALGQVSFREAGFYLDVSNDPLQPSRVIIKADQFSITNNIGSGGTRFAPFIFEDGVAKMMAARINEITAGIIRNATGTSYFNLTTGGFRLSAV